jgi:hypothetical protein
METEERPLDGEDAEVEGEIVEDDFVFPQWYESEFSNIMGKNRFAQRKEMM